MASQNPPGWPPMCAGLLITIRSHNPFDAFCNFLVRFQMDPGHATMPAEPGHLAFGELARAHFDQRNGFLQGSFASQIFHHLPVADGLHGGWIFFETARQELLGFCDQAVPEHIINARFDAGMKVSARSGQTNDSCCG